MPPRSTADLARPGHREGAARSGAIVVVLFLALSTALVALNADLPIVRNAFIYAKVAKAIAAEGFDPRPVVVANEKSYGKPVGFAWLCAPLVTRLGPSLGTKLGSLLGTAFFALVALAFARYTKRRLGLSGGVVPLQLGLLLFNPLVLYQAWSSYPDTLFSGLVVVAFLLTEGIVECRGESRKGSILLLGLVIYVSILTKLYGLILGLACPLVVLASWLSSARGAAAGANREGTEARSAGARRGLDLSAPWRIYRRTVPWLALVFTGLGLLVIGARLGWHATFDLGARRSGEHSVGLTELGEGLRSMSIGSVLDVLASWVGAFGLCFGLTLLALAWCGGGTAWPHRWTLFVAVYLGGLVPFGDNLVYNMRYALPVFPFVALAVARGMVAIPERSTRHGLLALHGVFATVLVLHFNVPAVHQQLRPLDERFLQPIANRASRLDNLRMAQHLELQRQLVAIGRSVEPNGMVFWAWSYGGDMTHGVVEDLELREDVRLRYSASVIASQLQAGRAIWVAYDLNRPRDSARRVRHYADRAVATSEGDGLVRLEPFVVLRMVESEGEPGVAPPAFEAAVPEALRAAGLSVEITVDGRLAGRASTPPYRVVWTEPTAGRHRATAHLVGPNLRVASAPVWFFVGVAAIEVEIVDCFDDVEGSAGLPLYLDSSDLELVDDDYRGLQVVGLRFPEVDIAPGASVKTAHLQFTADGSSAAPTVLEIRAERSASAAPFSIGSAPRERPVTTAAVTWEPPLWLLHGERGLRQRTPDLGALVSEVVSDPGWRRGGALAFVITGSGRRTARACDGAGALGSAPTLYVELGP